MDRLTFVHRGRPRSSLLVSVLFFVLSALPWVAPASLTLLRALTSAGLLLIALLLLRLGYRPSRRVVIAPRRGELQLAQGPRPLSDVRALVLRGSGDTAIDPVRLRYRAELRLNEGSRIANPHSMRDRNQSSRGRREEGLSRPHPEGARQSRSRIALADLADDRHVLILESTDPADVLVQIGQLLRYWSVPIERGWGLPDRSTPWASTGATGTPQPSAKHSSPTHLTVHPHRSQQHVTIAVLASALGVGLLVAAMGTTHLQAGEAFTLLSIVLPAITIALMLAVAAAVGTYRIHVTSNSELTICHRLFGIVIRRTRLLRTSLRRAYAVGPVRGEPLHVLCETDQGPVAIPCADSDAPRLLQTLDALSPLHEDARGPSGFRNAAP